MMSLCSLVYVAYLTAGGMYLGVDKSKAVDNCQGCWVVLSPDEEGSDKRICQWVMTKECFGGGKSVISS
jgi:hypothetical protein